MLTATNISLRFSDRKLFDDVNIKFTPGNCYGIIGANGAGKSTFLRILSGALEPTTGDISIGKGERMSVLKQDHYAFDNYSVLDTVILGNPRLYEIGKEKDALYMKEDFSEEDGILASELEAEFAELGGWEAESDAAKLLQSLGITEDLHEKQMSTLSGAEKVKVILAQALFGNPDILILDEPTNDLDIASITWLEEFLIDFQGIVIVVSHDRHFLNNVCTMMADVDFGKIKVYPGNYDFWYQSSQLAMQLSKDQNRKKEEKIKDLEAFVARFSANASKSKQATSRKKMLEKITLDDIPQTSRRYPFVGFTKDREVGNDILRVDSVSKTLDDELLLNDISFTVQKGDKIAFLGKEQAVTALFEILMGGMEPDSGSVNWGVTITSSYFPRDNSAFFDENDHLDLVDWIRQYSPDPGESFVRGFLGRMLFSGEEVFKDSSVLSGGEKVRLMLSRMMMKNANLLVLDQPTNHLDLESITALNNGLQEFDSNILFSSHDHEFMETIANRVIEILPDGTIFDKSVSYDEYLEWRQTQQTN